MPLAIEYSQDNIAQAGLGDATTKGLGPLAAPKVNEVKSETDGIRIIYITGLLYLLLPPRRAGAAPLTLCWYRWRVNTRWLSLPWLSTDLRMTMIVMIITILMLLLLST